MNTSRSAHATTTAATSSSSRRSNHWKYEVFLSLGDDTRTTFTDHLYDALCGAGINTFVDKENIQSELDREIEGSRVAVVVFSKSYAESRYCLRELSMIMRYREDQEGKVVYPIFYDVDPSHVRKQSGSFREAFRKHERDEDPNEVEQWRKDLKACADLSGRNLKTTADGREALFIRNVVREIIGLTKPRDLQTSQALGWNTLPRKELQAFEDPDDPIIVFFKSRTSTQDPERKGNLSLQTMPAILKFIYVVIVFENARARVAPCTGKSEQPTSKR
ncbi:hypothetical protein ACFX13_023759 [Malus domestica]